MIHIVTQRKLKILGLQEQLGNHRLERSWTPGLDGPNLHFVFHSNHGHLEDMAVQELLQKPFQTHCTMGASWWSCDYCRFLKKIKYSSILLTLHSIHSQVFLLPTLSTIYCTLHPHCLKDNFRTFWMQISFGILQVFLFPVCTANFEGYLYCVPFIDNFPWC